MTTQPLDEEAIFHAARAMESLQDRAAYLGQACGDNAALRARVEGLLKIFADEKSLAGSPAAILDVIEHPQISERPGTVIGPYKLMEQIGEGGFGLVFVAEQQQPVRRKVALKVIKPGMDMRDVIARFEAERQALALMDHLNIAKVFDAGATDSGRPYFVMELVRGVPITEYCDEQHLATRERLELFVAICHAIQHAHQKGIIHRDMKPTNVLVTEHDGRPVVKVIDFGVSKALSQHLTERTIYTQFAQMIGTPLYMSPEQAAMSGLDIDTRSDIYSLGVLLYELLTGTTPFDPDRLRKAGADEIRRIVREEEPPKPSTRVSTLKGEQLSTIADQRRLDPRKLSQSLRGDLDWIVMKCLEKDRNRRYETVNGLARDVERHLHDEPVLACPPSAVYRLKKFVRRNRFATTFTALLLIGVAALAVSTIQSQRNERRANVESAKAKAVSDLLQRMLASSNPDEMKGAEYTIRQLLDDFSAGLGNGLAGQPEVEAQIRATIGNAYRRLGLQDQAEPHLSAALRLRQQQFGPDHVETARALVDYAWSLYERGDLVGAEQRAREGLAIHRKLGIQDNETVEFLSDLQLFVDQQKRYEDAEAIAQEALSIARQQATQSPVVADILHRLAASAIKQGNPAKGEELARESVALHRKLHGSKHPETAWGLQLLGRALLQQAKYSDAEDALREALAIFRQHYSADHKSLEITVGDLKQVLEARGDRAGIEALLRQQLAEETKKADPAIFDFWLKQGTLHNDLKESKEAIDCFQKAIDVNPKSLLAYNYLINLLYEERDWEAGIKWCRKAIELEPKTAWPYNHLGYGLIMHGDVDGAIASYRQAIDLNPKYAIALNNLGNAQLEKGDVDEAIASYRQQVEADHSAGAHVFLGRGLYQKKDYDGAIAAYRRAIELDPNDPRGVTHLTGLLTELGRLDELEALQCKAVEDLRARLPEDDAKLGDGLATLANTLLNEKKFAEAEPVARECLRIREQKSPDDWRTHNARSMLGGSLLGQAKYDEAEPLLLSGYKGMKQREATISLESKPRLSAALQRLVHLFEATNQIDQAAEWKERLAEFDQSQSATKAAVAKP